MSPQSTQGQPSPMRVMQALWGFQLSGVLKAGIDLDVFTAIDEGNVTVEQLARRCQAAPRGMRILCDSLTIHGFLEKAGSEYHLTPDSALFLSRRSRAYMGSVADFIASPMQFDLAKDVAGAVRHGGTLLPGDGPLEANYPEWVRFARAMAPMMRMPAQEVGNALEIESSGAAKILDIAAGHGTYGITLAQRNPQAQVVAVDWAPVLEVAQENAEAAGVESRYHLNPGSAFEVDLGTDYDIVLLPNFLHHFDEPTNVKLLQRMRAALKPQGRVAIVEFVPNDDRVTPPFPASFSVVMLLTTPAGDAYTFAQLSGMLAKAGFAEPAQYPISDAPGSIVLARNA